MPSPDPTFLSSSAQPSPRLRVQQGEDLSFPTREAAKSSAAIQSQQLHVPWLKPVLAAAPSERKAFLRGRPKGTAQNSPSEILFHLPSAWAASKLAQLI